MGEDLLSLTVDVEWAAPEVLSDLVRLLDEREIKATFFCTHAGIVVPGHERALHPNYRRSGDLLRSLRGEAQPALEEWTDAMVYDYVIGKTREYCPEAVGVRAHSLNYDSEMLPIYRKHGIEYDSSYFLPFFPGIQPVLKEHGILEFPGFYMDHIDLLTPTTAFELGNLRLNTPGLKIFDFQPRVHQRGVGDPLSRVEVHLP